MTPALPLPRPCNESALERPDGARLFYRAWAPLDNSAPQDARVLVFLHRGHEHSGRVQPLVDTLARPQDWAFAWDARGHGHSTGERGDAPDFMTLVEDFEAFVRHLQARFGLAAERMLMVANSVGAVTVATWLQDYATPVRGVIMAAAAFDINLYVPLAKPALRLASCFKPGLFVTSYIRAGMLTHSAAQAEAYQADPLITSQISARVLLSLASTAHRVVDQAPSVHTPVLMLVADKDYVVKTAPQRRYFDRLSSGLKRWVLIPNCHHAIFYEDTAQCQQALDASSRFIEDCFAAPAGPSAALLVADREGYSASQFAALQQGRDGHAAVNGFYALQKRLLGLLGSLSDGMRIGLQQGFDSGASLDHVYRNQPGGRWGVGKQIDAGYLGAIGWRGIRQRKAQLQQTLAMLIDQHPPGRPVRILDLAAGGGRYVLETLKRCQGSAVQLTLRDLDEHNLDLARALAARLMLQHEIRFERCDAFDPASYSATTGGFDIVIVSGLFELFSDNAPVLKALQGAARSLAPGGHLVYTNQPWHPQLNMIARTLTNHVGKPWQMRPRPQAEMDALVASVGLRKQGSQVGVAGIFTVSVAQAAPAGLA